MFRKLVILMGLTFMLSGISYGGQTACPQHFADGQAPDLISSLLPRTKELCFSEFAVKHSGVTRTALYASEHLTKDRLVKAKSVPRHDAFHPEQKLLLNERAELRDYTRSGYDRGHVAPDADFSTPEFQLECFSLANMVPQNPTNNRGVWSKIEAAVRNYTKSTNNSVYVVTGSIYDANPKKIGNVSVPTKLFKAMYDENRKMAGAYLVDNASKTEVQQISLYTLKQMSGIDVFPSLPDVIKNTCMRLPTPHGN